MWSLDGHRVATRTFLSLALLAASQQALAAPVPWVRRQRQLHIVEDRPDAIVTDNFRWGRVETPAGLKCEWQRTTIRPERVAEVYWWSENFPPKWIAAHGQLVFVMKDTDGVRGADGRESIGFVVSVEAHLRQDQSYNFLVGMSPKRQYGVIYTVTTIEDRIQRAALLYGHSMDTYRLKLSEQQKQDLVRVSLRTSAVERPDEAYHTTRNSCITSGMQMLNQVLPEGRRVRLWTIPKLLANIRVSYPKFTAGFLIGKGLAERAGKFDESVRELRFPTDSGQDHVIDVLEMPGSGVPKEARALEEALFRFGQEVRTVRDMTELQGLVPAGSEKFFAVQKTLVEAQRAAEGTLDDVLELAAASPGPAALLVAGQELPDEPEVRFLRKALVRRLQGEITGGGWTPSPEEQEALDTLAGRE